MISAIRTSTHLGVKIHLPAREGSEPTPIDLALLLDTSGSMDGERLDAVKRTLRAARDLFIPTDQITLVTFDDRATVIANRVRMDAAGIEQFYTAVDAVRANGSTNLSAGIEKLLVTQGSMTYDAILLLTDGHINAGITSTVGLRSMMCGLGEIPVTGLGYGADHNRVLLRDLATRSRGAYVYVDSESVLPIAMGDMIGGLRAKIYKNAMIHVPTGWRCCETDGGGASYRIGSIVPDRDYWVIFEKHGDEVEAAPITLSPVDGPVIAEVNRVMVSDCQDLQEQVLRCRVAKAIVAASDCMEQGRLIGPEIAALDAEFKALSEHMRLRPLVLRMQAQLAEILAEPPPSVMGYGLPPPSALLARMSSGGAYLATQRGVSSTGGGDPHDVHTFSSPLQQTASNQVQQQSQVV
jgi:hypothetical protein